MKIENVHDNFLLNGVPLSTALRENHHISGLVEAEKVLLKIEMDPCTTRLLQAAMTLSPIEGQF